MAFDAMRQPNQSDLRVLFANVEMSPWDLLDRELARLSSMSHEHIRERTFRDDHNNQIGAGTKFLATLVPRLSFMQGPFTLQQLTELVSNFRPNLVILDYVQRFDLGRHRDERAQVARVMDKCREIANQGCAVIAVAAVNRASGGSASLSAIRDSSEVEYGCDVIYQLVRKSKASDAKLKALTNRHGVLKDINLTFRGEFQEFC